MSRQDDPRVAAFDRFLEAASRAEYAVSDCGIDDAIDTERAMNDAVARLHQTCPNTDLEEIYGDRNFSSEEERARFLSYALAAYLYALRPSKASAVSSSEVSRSGSWIVFRR